MEAKTETETETETETKTRQKDNVRCGGNGDDDGRSEIVRVLGYFDCC